MVVNWMASVLLLSAYLFSVCELVLDICWENVWWTTCWSFRVCAWPNVVVHVKYFLLLGSQLLIWSSACITSWIHNSKSHTSRNEYVSALSIIWWYNSCFYHVVVVNCLVNSWMDTLWVLVAIVSHVSAVVCSDCSFLVVTVKLLNI